MVASLTGADYILHMNDELAALETKINALVSLCAQLRHENASLKELLGSKDADNRRLAAKVDGAKARVEQLLAALPESDA